MIRKAKVDVYECACTMRYYVEDGDMLSITGITGTVREQAGGGGSACVEWFACSRGCVPKAIEAALQRAWEQ